MTDDERINERALDIVSELFGQAVQSCDFCPVKAHCKDKQTNSGEDCGEFIKGYAIEKAGGE